ncbi:MAG: hypothetical protein WCO42_05230 [bacterium]
MRRLGFILFCVAVAGVSGAGPVNEIEVTPDPPRNGSQIFTLRFNPGETLTYEKLTFDCTYRQSFPSQTSDQPTGLKIIEPEVFTYRSHDVKMVENLDCHVSFRVPLDIHKLQEIYGEHSFNTNYPAVVSKIKVTASEKENVLWSYVLKPEGLHEFPSAVTNAVSKP